MIYAKSEGEPGTHHIVNVWKDDPADGLDLTVSPTEILAQIDQLAIAIRAHAAKPSVAAA